ncbi:hypothetical protein EIN_121160 [Entamoeba invadens IP1]|uniref:Protein kinase domain-containing protein n=1 Tax=Entamoeba invadens IP1 TaxID=370355 RepID=L7FN23_ENTIV|nr:hypothetical protein EIN_121160 [Entamoeba invadens IP1]ELP92533.1 hypothetical protein EIN_121160 [Entamoeba invadens IP1]|eukprot:XP_004259304.1 hypothetical protein EIN_121160 [Entamoeba invadens IP1]
MPKEHLKLWRNVTPPTTLDENISESTPNVIMKLEKSKVPPPSLTSLLTTKFSTTYNKCSDTINFSTFISKRVLTFPSTPATGKENENYDLIVTVDDMFGSFYSKSTSMRVESAYRVIGMLGRGSFGQVFRCVDMNTKQLVALKILKNQLVYLRQGMLEITVLTILNDFYNTESESNTVKMLDHFVQEGHLCIVFELLSLNLYDVLNQNGFHGFPYNFNRSVAKQLLHSLNVLHRNGIVHCDLS